MPLTGNAEGEEIVCSHMKVWGILYGYISRVASIDKHKGNILQFVYFHTSKFDITATETQWNLGFIAANVGADVVTGADVWTEESVALTSGAGSVLGTPINTSSGNLYGWVTDSNGNTSRVTFTGKDFTYGTTSQTVTVRYYENDTAATQVTISGNIIPSVVRLVLDAQLFSSSGGATGGSVKIGHVLVECANAQLTGAQKIDLKSSGTSSTPLALSAVADINNNYATITEVITNANWYDNVNMLAISNNNITLASGTATLKTYAIPDVGSAFLAPIADLTYSSSNTGVATVGAHTGIVTYVGAGSTVITATITNKNTVSTVADVTCS